jgi:hypothetical protein
VLDFVQLHFSEIIDGFLAILSIGVFYMGLKAYREKHIDGWGVEFYGRDAKICASCIMIFSSYLFLLVTQSWHHISIPTLPWGSTY